MTHLKTQAPRHPRSDHVGSLLRPNSLIGAFLKRGRGEIGDDELRRAGDAAIRDVVKKQEAHGHPIPPPIDEEVNAVLR